MLVVVFVVHASFIRKNVGEKVVDFGTKLCSITLTNAEVVMKLGRSNQLGQSLRQGTNHVSK